MRTPRYLTLKEIGKWALLAHIPVAVYVFPLIFQIYSGAASWLACIVGYLGALLMFNWKVDVGEEGCVLLFGHDTGLRTGPGNFPMPSIFPFLRGGKLILGYSVEVPSQQHHGNTVAIHHFQDQHVPSVRVNVESGQLAALVGLATSNLVLWLWDIFEPNGKLKFGKVGGYLYFGSWAYALAAHG
jgi:hypothetical protein